MKSFPTLRVLALAGAFLCCFMLIGAGYSNTFQSPPVLDDFHTFVKNPSVHVDKWSVDKLKALATTYFGLARWIPMTSLAFDYYLGGGSYAQFHLTNLLIHLFATLAVAFLMRQCLLTARTNPSARFGLAPALWIAAIWALNPVQTNAVTYMVQRMASLQALFFTAGVACYLAGRRRYAATSSMKIAGLWFGMAALFAWFGFFTKENSAMLPIMLVASEIWFFNPDGVSRAWRWFGSRSWPWRLLIGAALTLLLIKLGFYVVQLWNGYGSRHFGPWERLLTESRVVVWYMGLLLLPLPQRLSIEHDVLVSTALFSPPTTILSIALILLMIVLIIVFRKRYPLITYGGLWFFLNLAIESTLVPLELLFEHRLYLPSIGLVMAVLLLLGELVSRGRHRFTDREWQQLSWASVAILCAGLTLMTFQRNEDWRDPITFNRDAVEKAPNLPRTHANYASALMQAGRFEEARNEAERAIALGRPGLEDYVVAADTIVGTYMREDNWHQAARLGEDFLHRRPDDSNAMTLPQLELMVAQSLRRIGDYHKAYEHTLQAVKVMAQMGPQSAFLTPYALSEMRQLLAVARSRDLDLDGDGVPDPGPVSESTWMARAFVSVDAYQDARRLLAIGLEQQPDDALALSILNKLNVADEKNLKQGRSWNFSGKYVKQPYSPFNFCMAIAYSIRKHSRSASLLGVGEKFVRMAEWLNPSHPDAHLLMAWYHYERNETTAAVAEAHQALAIDPDYAKAWMGLGLFLMNTSRKVEAAAALEKVLDLYPGYRKRQTIVNMLVQLQGTGVPAEEAAQILHPGPPDQGLSQPSEKGLADLAAG